MNNGEGGQKKEKKRVTYVVKPINRNRYYKPGKDRRKRRVKRVRLKDPKPKQPKKKAAKDTTQTNSFQPDADAFPTEETDSLPYWPQ